MSEADFERANTDVEESSEEYELVTDEEAMAEARKLLLKEDAATDDSGNFERYEPEEKDWGHPPMGYSPSNWESSPKFKFKKDKPVHVGYYSANYGYGSTYGSLYWDGNHFGDWEYGKFNPVIQKGIVYWQGYNWDTSSWVNRPPVPPDVQCSNKKCGWIGNGTDRIEDDEYNDHCPECNGTDFDWIDYDPDTAKGRKNRELHCRPWDPAVALSKLPVPDTLKVDVECVQCEWRGTVDETNDNDGEMVCPECGEKGLHYVSVPMSLQNIMDGMPSQGFWTCEFYYENGRRIQ